MFQISNKNKWYYKLCILIALETKGNVVLVEQTKIFFENYEKNHIDFDLNKPMNKLVYLNIKNEYIKFINDFKKGVDL